jgi:hypothetical protein
MIRQIAVAASIALLGISGQAMAAQTVQLANVKGSVLVNQNGRYAPATSETTLRAGDRVLAMNGGAQLTYANGCLVDMSARSMVTVSDAACGGSDIIKAQYTEGEGTYQGEQGTFSRSGDLWLFLGFGLLTAVVVAAAFSDDETPVSP